MPEATATAAPTADATPAAAPAEPAAAPAAAPAAEAAKPAEPAKTELDKVEPAVAKPDPKTIAAEQEKRLEDRATKLRAELHQRQKSLEEKEKALAQRDADLKELEQLRAAKSLAKDDPLGWLEANGLDFESVAKAAAEGRGMDPAARQALAEAKALKAKLEAREKAEAEAKAKAEEEAAKTKAAENEKAFVGELNKMLEAGGKDFRFTRALGSADDVKDAAYEAYKKSGKMPDLRKIALAVEEFYRSQAKNSSSIWAEYEAETKAAEAEKPKAAAAPAAPATEPPKAATPAKEEPAPSPTKPDLRGRGRTRRAFTEDLAKQLEAVRAEREKAAPAAK